MSSSTRLAAQGHAQEMEIRGIPVSPGVAIGPALMLDTELFRIPQRFVEPAQADEEVGRLKSALGTAAEEARANQDEVSAKLGQQFGAIFAAHSSMLADAPFRR